MGLWEFAKRHKNKFLIIGGATGAVFAINKILASYEKQWQTSSSRGFVHEARKKEIHFENIIDECNQICHNLTPVILKKLKQNLNDENIINDLESKKEEHDISTKKELWKTLKVKIITRLVSEIYCTCILVCSLRVQMSVVGGHLYTKKNADVASGSSSASVAELTHMKVYQKYIELLTTIHSEKINNRIEPVEAAVEEAMKSYSIEKEISMQDFKTVLDKIKQSMSILLACPESKNKLIFNSDALSTLDFSSTSCRTTLTEDEEATLKKMLDETQDIFENEEFKTVLDVAVNVGFESLLDSILDIFIQLDGKNTTSNTNSKNHFKNPNASKVLLVKLLPKLRNILLKRKEHDEKAFVNQLLCLDVLNCFASNVYDAFCT